jgi:phage portal protein BeeE
VRRPAILTRDWWLNAPGDPASERYSTLNPSGAAYVISSLYGRPDIEKILPTWLSYVQQGYQLNPIVFAAIGARLSLFSEATLKWRSLTDKHLFGTPELGILERPWPNGTTGELLARMIQDVDLAGNAYVRYTGPGPNAGLERLRPDLVTIVSELHADVYGRSYRVPVGYYYEPDPADADREPALFSSEEVAHWSPIPDPQANFRGMSWLTPILRELEADQGLTAYKTMFLENAATPNLLIKYPAKMKPGTLSELQERLTARFGGVGNAFKTLTVDQGADATMIGNTFEQMMFTDVQAAGENRILLASGVPGIVVGSKEGLQAATYSNYEQAMRRFADLTMRPLWRSVCACLAALVTVPAGAHLWFDTSDIAALRQGEQERAQTVLTKSTAAETLLRAGYTADTVAAAIEAGDLTLLSHTGLFSTQLTPPGAAGAGADPAADPTAGLPSTDPSTDPGPGGQP